MGLQRLNDLTVKQLQCDEYVVYVDKMAAGCEQFEISFFTKGTSNKAPYSKPCRDKSAIWVLVRIMGKPHFLSGNDMLSLALGDLVSCNAKQFLASR